MDKKLLNKYFANKCNEEEFRQVMKYFLSEMNIDHALNDIESAWYDYSSAENFKDRQLQSIRAKLNHSLRQQQNQATVSKPRYYLKVAATLSLLAVFTFAFFYYLQPKDQPLQSTTELPTTINKENPKGQKLRVVLKDGSVVIINAESSITYNSSFGIDNRFLQLQGEAFFEVMENQELPFTVQTQKMTVVALGTAFNVQSAEHAGLEKVALATGKVKISSFSNDTIILQPGEMVSIQKKSFSKKQVFDPVQELGWKDGLLVFKNNSLAQVVQKLERWYGVEVQVVNDQDYPDWSYTGQYNNVSLEKVLQGISFTKAIEYEIKGESVKIKI